MAPTPDQPQLSIATARESDGGRTVMRVDGEVDLATADQLDAAVRGELAAGPVLLDLGGITFMDSSGVRLLDALLRDGERAGWELAIGTELTPAVVQVLELTGMMDVLPFAGDGEAGGP